MLEQLHKGHIYEDSWNYGHFIETPEIERHSSFIFHLNIFSVFCDLCDPSPLKIVSNMEWNDMSWVNGMCQVANDLIYFYFVDIFF